MKDTLDASKHAPYRRRVQHGRSLVQSPVSSVARLWRSCTPAKNIECALSFTQYITVPLPYHTLGVQYHNLESLGFRRKEIFRSLIARILFCRALLRYRGETLSNYKEGTDTIPYSSTKHEKSAHCAWGYTIWARTHYSYNPKSDK